jgi:hypothetical protein
MIEWKKYVSDRNDHAFCGDIIIGWIYERNCCPGVYRYALEFQPGNRMWWNNAHDVEFPARSLAKKAVENAWAEHLDELGLIYKEDV